MINVLKVFLCLINNTNTNIRIYGRYYICNRLERY